MKIATFNINGILARHDALLSWLYEAKPDVVCLQETKKVDAEFPREAFEAMGYRVELHGMKSFNGVAILSKLPLEDVTRRLAGDEADEHTRWIEATVMGRRPVRVTSLYLPNGNPAPGPKFDFKLAWMERMRLRVAELLKSEEPLVFCGDYNIIPQAEDAANPKNWLTDALFLPESRAAFQRVVNLGMTEAFRACDQRPGQWCGAERPAHPGCGRRVCGHGDQQRLVRTLGNFAHHQRRDPGGCDLLRRYHRPRRYTADGRGG